MDKPGGDERAGLNFQRQKGAARRRGKKKGGLLVAPSFIVEGLAYSPRAAFSPPVAGEEASKSSRSSLLAM